MNVVFQTTNKKRNSTAQVTGGSTYACKLKTGCGVLHPVITLQWNGVSSPTAYNYCTIQEFGRCYWIDEWTYDDRQWTASCSVDTLGTYKTEIGTTAKYILRAEDAYDIHVIDNKYPAKTPPETTRYSIQFTDWVVDRSGFVYNDGYYIIGVTGYDGNDSFFQGGLMYAQLSASEFAKMIKSTYSKSMDTWDLMGPNSDFGAALKQFGKNLYNTVANPLDYISSVKWFPFSFTTDSQFNVQLGPILTDGKAYTLTTPVKIFTYTITLNTMSELFDWEKIEPYMTYKLVIPPFGSFALDAREVSLGEGVFITIYADAISGMANLQVTPRLHSTKCLVAASGQVGTDVAIHGANANAAPVLAAAGAVAGTAAAAVTGGAGAAVGTAISGIATAANQNYVDFVSSGFSGGISSSTDYKALYQTKYHHVDQNPHEFGYPLCDYQILGGHSGYLLCADPEIELTGATPYERDEVGQFLVGGFYYE